MIVLRSLLLVSVFVFIAVSQSDETFQDETKFKNIDEIEEKIIEPRAIASSESEASQQSANKFHVYVGTIDGVRREIFNEVDGDGDILPDNAPNPDDPFSAYDDNTIIETKDEKTLFVPKPYRPGSKQKISTTATTTRPTIPSTTIRTIPFVQTTAAPRRPIVQFPQTTPSHQPEQIRPISPQRPAQPPQPFVPRTRRPPFRPPTQPLFPQQRPSFNQQPLQTQSPFQQPQEPRQSTFNQQSFQQQTSSQQSFQTQSSFRQPQQPQPAFRPSLNAQPPFRSTTQFSTRPRTTTTVAPQLPFANHQNLRTGVCPLSIFYISTPINGPTRLTFSHFAVAVTVDQCARTCHEFNCAIAHYNPNNGHCEFNPSTAFAIRNGQCPAWPGFHYRNNVVANQPIRIFCVTCQRPRRRPNRQRVGLRRQSQDIPQGNSGSRLRFRRRWKSRKSSTSISNHPVIHGVLVRQPKAVALGVSQVSLSIPIQPQSQDKVVVGVSPLEFENGESTEIHEERRSSKSKSRDSRIHKRTDSTDDLSSSSLILKY
ncbi:hypothetical protein KIN20_009790 [Parelaphostrongylus tenuis]|uniref:Apple domain-containing protein n=1 Tax=Parelaphostrongylus tenuis TaxID=148309 RepID=A0AAD5QIF0_PARTN|nr:hypothetical protein KIN20_009790 [Parelaphostrongylus tenuis]